MDKKLKIFLVIACVLLLMILIMLIILNINLQNNSFNFTDENSYYLQDYIDELGERLYSLEEDFYGGNSPWNE